MAKLKAILPGGKIPCVCSLEVCLRHLTSWRRVSDCDIARRISRRIASTLLCMTCSMVIMRFRKVMEEMMAVESKEHALGHLGMKGTPSHTVSGCQCDVSY
jgi:hypothetical protein